MKPLIAALTSLVLLSACGGGGSGGRDTSSPHPLGTMSNSFVATQATVLTASPSASTPIDVRIDSTVSGQLSPARSEFTIVGSATAITYLGVRAAGNVTLALTSGTPASGVWTGTTTVRLPPLPAGNHIIQVWSEPEPFFDIQAGRIEGVQANIVVSP